MSDIEMDLTELERRIKEAGTAAATRGEDEDGVVKALSIAVRSDAVILRCPGGCDPGGYMEPPAPEEDCPVHGRDYEDMWRLRGAMQEALSPRYEERYAVALHGVREGIEEMLAEINTVAREIYSKRWAEAHPEQQG